MSLGAWELEDGPGRCRRGNGLETADQFTSVVHVVNVAKVRTKMID
jgi:hypothetical protein